jgi:GxxExxY protein
LPGSKIGCLAERLLRRLSPSEIRSRRKRGKRRKAASQRLAFGDWDSQKGCFADYLLRRLGLAENAENAENNFAFVALYLKQKNMTENEISYQIRGAIYDVFKTLGPGLLESVYEEALVYELEQRGLSVERQKLVPVVYKGVTLKTDLRLDLLVEDKVIVELKSVTEMKDVFYKQTLTYCKLLNKKLGILVNFNVDDILDGAITRVANRL